MYIRVNNPIKSLAGILAIAIFFVIIAHHTYGQAMNSSNYVIESDSINFGGGHSESESYSLEDTIGEIATGVSSSTNYTMMAGYQQMQNSVIAVVPAGNVTMSPSIGGLSGGISNGSTSFTVITDNSAGYQVTLESSTSPALQSATDSFADYVPAGAVPDYTFTNLDTASSFGFTPEGADIVSKYKDNGSNTCGTGSSDTADKCWDGLSTTAEIIVSRPNQNQTAGTVTTLKFRAESGSEHVQQDGNYTATATVTIIPQ